MCEAYSSCPAERNLGNSCLYPDLRKIAFDCGAPCCSAGICNVSASFAAPTVHRPTDDEARKVFLRMASASIEQRKVRDLLDMIVYGQMMDHSLRPQL